MTDSTVIEDNDDVMTDMRYICKSCSLITEALQKGCDVMQMPNGDIIISELKLVTFQYTWDNVKGKLVRTQVGAKTKKYKPRKKRVYIESSKISNFELAEEEV